MNQKSSFSVFKGFTFTFEVDGNRVDAWFSALSGLEKVFLNGSLVSSQRNLSRDSTNVFSIGNDQYSTNLHTDSLRKGPYVCTLNKNGAPFRRQKLVFPGADRKILGLPLLGKLLLALAVGALCGLAQTFLQLPTVAFYSALIVIMIAVSSREKTDRAHRWPVIEEEEISNPGEHS